jgi:predicted methyltransferase
MLYQLKTILFNFLAGLILFLPLPAMTADIESLLDRAIAAEHRDAANRSRDAYRNPRETLLFFGLQPDMTVLEITPGGGWYTEILAPVLNDNGQLIVASFGEDHPIEYLADVHRRYMQKLDADPGTYGKVKRILFKEDEYLQSLSDKSVDMVLTFRNTHNWIRQSEAEAVYAAIYRVLEYCGTLGVVQHRADPGADPKTSAESGYIPEAYMIDLIESTGFRLVDSSEINANPLDTKDHPEGVWTLPPSYRMGDQDREKYTDIGESDRMTLRFVKPIRLADSGCATR